MYWDGPASRLTKKATLILNLSAIQSESGIAGNIQDSFSPCECHIQCETIGEYMIMFEIYFILQNISSGLGCLTPPYSVPLFVSSGRPLSPIAEANLILLSLLKSKSWRRIESGAVSVRSRFQLNADAQNIGLNYLSAVSNRL